MTAGYLLRRVQEEYVDVQFEDGSAVRLSGETEGRDLLDDVYTILESVR